jgi:uncharacterized membrane protein affecting hemolysin expression
MIQVSKASHHSRSNSSNRSIPAMMIISLVSVLLTLALASFVRAQEKKAEAGKPPDAAAAAALAEVRRAIDKGNAQWIEAWEKGDPAMVAAIFTEDGSLLARDGKVIKGRQQILERQRAAMHYVGREVKVAATTVLYG